MKRFDDCSADISERLPFAWRFAPPNQRVKLPGEAQPVPRVRTAVSPARKAPAVKPVPILRDAEAESPALADAVTAAWMISDVRAQADATRAIARRADGLIQLEHWARYPGEAAQFGQLLVRHWAKWSTGDRRLAERCIAAVPLWHAHARELLMQLVTTGNRTLADAVLVGMDGRIAAMPRPVMRELANHVENGKTWATRIVALEVFDAVECGPDDVPVFQRAVRLANLEARTLALRLLVEHARGTEADDALCWLLDDLSRRTVDETDDLATEYLMELFLAVHERRPVGGDEPLQALLASARERSYGDGPGEEWVLELLALTYPRVALPEIVRMLHSTSVRVREQAVVAAASLPADVAAEALELAATDGAPSVAMRARDVWFNTFHARCPVPETAGVPLAWLDGAAPSREFEPRLMVLRYGQREARTALVQSLLARAGDPEAMVLLAFALADDELRSLGGKSYPSVSMSDWCEALIRLAGAWGVRVAVHLADRYSGAGPFESGWLSALRTALDRGVIDRSMAAPVRACAVRLVLTMEEPSHDALGILATLGAPAELEEKLWQLAADDPESAGASNAARCLVSATSVAHVAARVLPRIVEADRTGDDDTLIALAPIVEVAGDPGLDAAVWTALRQEHRTLGGRCVDALLHCVNGDRAFAQPSWVAEALNDPTCAAFVIAAWYARPNEDPTVRPKLIAGLTASAHQGACAIAAWMALMHSERKLSPRDPRIAQAFRMAALTHRVRGLHLVGSFTGIRPESLGTALAEMFESEDWNVIYELWDQFVSCCTTPAEQRYLRRVLPRTRDEWLRDEIHVAIGLVDARRESWLVDRRSKPHAAG